MKRSILRALLALLSAPVLSLASTSTDTKIEDAAKSSYNFRTVLENHVKARSDDGVVTLTGTLLDQDERALAENTVNNLPGVVAVVDKIKIEPEPAQHSDAWIAVKARTVLLVHANVSATSTKVHVTDGVVLLTGTVDNAAQKELTEEYVKEVEGVRSVTNDLVVEDNPATDKDHTMGEAIDDASITSQVKFALLTHSSTSALKTKISTTGGNVLVRGDANSDAEKDLVTKLANSVRGVRSVDNEMDVTVN